MKESLNCNIGLTSHLVSLFFFFFLLIKFTHTPKGRYHTLLINNVACGKQGGKKREIMNQNQKLKTSMISIEE